MTATGMKILETLRELDQEKAAETLFRDLDKPSLENLAYVLRHPFLWPKGFVWDYSQCDSCAMGLAHELWARHIDEADNDTGASIMAREFAIPYTVAKDVFLGSSSWIPPKNTWRGKVADFKAVTPEMVAAQIDAYLNGPKND